MLRGGWLGLDVAENLAHVAQVQGAIVAAVLEPGEGECGGVQLVLLHLPGGEQAGRGPSRDRVGGFVAYRWSVLSAFPRHAEGV